MRKYIILLAAVMLLHAKTIAQSVGINNNAPHVSAALDVTSTTKGMLVPRLTQAQRLAIASPAKGLLVYDSTSNSFWYRDGDSWQELVPGTNAWKLTGNSGTDSAINFLGTTDNQVLRFRINNEWAGELNHLYGNVLFGAGAGNPGSSGAYNTGVGHNILHLNTSGLQNTATGYTALYTNSSGNSNTASGASALYSNTNGSYNTAIGVGALYTNSTGYNNAAIGLNALYFNTNGTQNIAAGSLAMYSNTTGSYNIANGVTALYSNKTGNNSAAIGVAALYSNTSGYSNIAIGAGALYKNTIRNNLVAVGDSALYNNGTGASSSDDATANTAIGSKTLFSNTTGYGNTANGYRALYYNVAGVNNTAIGAQTLDSNTTGYNNTAVGRQALFGNTEGPHNTAVGYRALRVNKIGTANVAIGAETLFYNTEGSFNTAIGRYALLFNTTGSTNNAIGYAALNDNTTGFGNSAFGDGALGTNTTGFHNTSIGYQANVTSEDLTNATAIGSEAKVNASNKVRIGNSSVTVIEGQVDWSFPSDGRFKTNITESVKGLDFITRLRPVVYNFQTKKYDDFIRQDMPKRNAQFTGSQDFSESESIRHSGFVAQEVEKAAKEAGYDFNGIIAPKNEKQTYSLSYSQFVVPLVKAVQEQQQQIDEFKKVNVSLANQNEQLQKQLRNLIDEVSSLNKKMELLATK